ncbi:hypothetical protein A6A04_03750 [Paramagnetospirillum marisnigri]|uniref:AlgX/AlgJ SGNH hydrolase-like domain-containing protein n=1 Tax=Paramagnetospirillum marisnigri TaxID=1285242 RepID=A0A178MKW5_9PROT|nr:hypothetical protein [Paramagnetospirillum marisnigri]OAN49239.1 hypothetical protein A6A04_03750 [Paramagnetospirillum marisnigri]
MLGKLLRIVLVNGIGLIAGLLLVEVILRVATPFPVFEKSGFAKYHPILGMVTDPSFPEIDPEGFRNPDPPAHPDLVALGASATYGYNVTSYDSWPQVLGRLTGMSVYNYGIGGYNPLQFYWLMDAAVAKKPKVILVGLHVAKDMKDVCKLLVSNAYWIDWAARRSLDTTPCRDLSEAPVGEEGRDLGPTPLQRIKLAVRRTAIGSAIGTLVVDPYQDAATRQPGPGTVFFQDGRNDTFVSRDYSIFIMNNSDTQAPWSDFAMKLTETLFLEMAEKAKAQGIGFAVVFFPTKNSVVKPYLEEAGYKLPVEFLKGVANETHLEAHFTEFFDKAGIPLVQPRPALQTLMKNRSHVYPFRNDDHPLASGYAAIAQAVQQSLFSVKAP